MSVVLPNFTGGTQLNPYITTYEGLIKRVKHTLGYPLVNIEISDEQIVDFINESIEYFTKYAGYTEEYLVFDTRIYKANTGLQVEKLINSTCMYGLDQSAVNVIDLSSNTYYYSNGNVYVTISGEAEQVELNRSYQGPLLYENVKLQQSFQHTLSTAVVSVTANTYYTYNNSLYKTGSSFYLDPTLSLSGDIIQEQITTTAPEMLEQHFDSIYLVPLEEGTYYIHESNLYIAGSSTEDILTSTSSLGTLLSTVTLTPVFSTFETDSVGYVTGDVAPNTYFIKDNDLYKSSLYTYTDSRVFLGDIIQETIQELDIEARYISRQADVVDNTHHSFYIHDSSLWYAGNPVSHTSSLKGERSNIALLEVVPDSFIINDTTVNAVPVPPDTVYFYNNTLYKSGSAISLNNGYSEIGNIVQTQVFERLIYSDTVYINTDMVQCTPNTFYINGNSLYKSGLRVDDIYSTAGTLILENIVINPFVQDVLVQKLIDIVRLPASSYFIKDGNLMQSVECCDLNLSQEYSELGCVVVENIPIIINLLQGFPPCKRVSCVMLPPNTYYLFGGALCRSGEQSPFADYSYSGYVIQQTILSKVIDIFTDVYSLVSLPPQTLYISDGNLYCSGDSTNTLKANTSEEGNILIYSIVINPNITKESMPCINMYYDYDMSSYRKVIDVFTFEQGESTGINTLFTLEQAMAQQIYSSYMVGNFGFDLVTWEVLKGFIDTRNKVLAQKPHFRFDSRSQTLRIIPEPRPEESYLGLVGCYLERPLKDLVKERWVYDYTKALAMIAVGNTRGKYAGTGLFGGGNVNANDVRQQGITEKENLEKRLMTEYIDNNPPNFFVG